MNGLNVLKRWFSEKKYIAIHIFSKRGVGWQSTVFQYALTVRKTRALLMNFSERVSVVAICGIQEFPVNDKPFS